MNDPHIMLRVLFYSINDGREHFKDILDIFCSYKPFVNNIWRPICKAEDIPTGIKNVLELASQKEKADKKFQKIYRQMDQAFPLSLFYSCSHQEFVRKSEKYYWARAVVYEDIFDQMREILGKIK